MIVLVVLKNETNVLGKLEISSDTSIDILDALRLKVKTYDSEYETEGKVSTGLEFTKYQPLTTGADALFYNEDILHIHKDLQPEIIEYYKSYANKYFNRDYDVENLFAKKTSQKELH
jgi:hypothetical protein